MHYTELHHRSAAAAEKPQKERTCDALIVIMSTRKVEQGTDAGMPCDSESKCWAQARGPATAISASACLLCMLSRQQLRRCWWKHGHRKKH